jgi:hypothetical protein
MIVRWMVLFFIFAAASFAGPRSFADTQAVAKPKPEAKKVAVAAAPKIAALVPSRKPSALDAPIQKPQTLDPNSAVEVRGQARTLSMMLVLKNGKDGINFIKVRKDFRPEIQATDF